MFSSNVGSKVSGLYQTNGTPCATFRIENPDGAGGTNRLDITRTQNQESTAVSFEFTQGSNRWDLERGGGLCTETVQTSWTTNGGTIIRSQTYEVLNDQAQVVQKTIERHQLFGQGMGLVARILDPDGVALTDTNTYDSNGILQQEVRSDGSWRYLQYDGSGRRSQVLSSFGNQAPTTSASLERLG